MGSALLCRALRWGPWLALFALLCTPCAWAAEPPADADLTAEQLKAINEQIAKLNRKLSRTRQTRRGEQGELARIESAIGEQTRALAELDTQLVAQGEEEQRLVQRRQTLEAQLASQRASLEKLLRAAQRQDGHEYLRMLLDQEDPAAVGRTLAFYNYFHRARQARLDALRQTQRQLRQVAHELSLRRGEMEATRARQVEQLAALESRRGEREKEIKRLARRIGQQKSELQALEADKQQLEGLLQTIQEALNESRYALPNGRFKELRGQLRWPTRGQIGARFGESLDAKNLTWQGVLIQAPAGQEVRAVAGGKVVFAEWLRSYGMLMIIDHGDDYMSLYGHNQSLLRKAGDWVRPGELIATVGDSGGQRGAGLYFEIRVRGRPSNPESWCKGSP